MSQRRIRAPIMRPDEDEDVEMQDAEPQPAPSSADSSAPAPAAAAAPSPAVLNVSAILAGCSYADKLRPLCTRLLSDFAGQIEDMDSTLQPLTDVACAFVKRHGPAGEKTEKVQKQLAMWEQKIKICCQKQSELEILRHLLQLALNDAAASQIEPGRDWQTWLQLYGQKYEAREEIRNRLHEREQKALLAFRQEVFQVHHPGQSYREGSDPMEDEEVQEQVDTAVTEADVTCKIAQAIYSHPVRNSVCSHTYSREAIESHLLVKQQAADPPRRGAAAAAPVVLRPDFSCVCPLAGCKKQVSFSTLQSDKSMERRVKEFQRAQDLLSARGAPSAASLSSARSARRRMKEEDPDVSTDLTEDHSESIETEEQSNSGAINTSSARIKSSPSRKKKKDTRDSEQEAMEHN